MGSLLVPGLTNLPRLGLIDKTLVACPLVPFSLALFPECRGKSGEDNKDIKHHIWGVKTALDIGVLCLIEKQMYDGKSLPFPSRSQTASKHSCIPVGASFSDTVYVCSVLLDALASLRSILFTESLTNS